MKNGITRFLAIFLALAMCFGLFPASVLAEDEFEELPVEGGFEETVPEEAHAEPDGDYSGDAMPDDLQDAEALEALMEIADAEAEAEAELAEAEAASDEDDYEEVSAAEEIPEEQFFEEEIIAEPEDEDEELPEEDAEFISEEELAAFLAGNSDSDESGNYDFIIDTDTVLAAREFAAIFGNGEEYQSANILVCKESTLTLTGDCVMGGSDTHMHIFIEAGSEVQIAEHGSLMLLDNSGINGEGDESRISGRIYKFFGTVENLDYCAEEYYYGGFFPVDSAAAFRNIIEVIEEHGGYNNPVVDSGIVINGNLSIPDQTEVVFKGPVTVNGTLDLGWRSKIALDRNDERNTHGSLTVNGDLNIEDEARLEVYDDSDFMNYFNVYGTVHNYGEISLHNRASFSADSYWTQDYNDWDFRGRLNLNAEAGSVADIPENRYIDVYWDVESADELLTAFNVLKSEYSDCGYRGVGVNVHGDISTEDKVLTVPEGLYFNVNTYWNWDDENNQDVWKRSEFTVASGTALVVFGRLGVDEGCTLTVENGAKLYAYSAEIRENAALDGSSEDVYLFQSNNRRTDIYIDDGADVCEFRTAIEPDWKNGEADDVYIVGNGFDVYTYTPDIAEDDETEHEYLVSGFGESFRSIGVAVYEGDDNFGIWDMGNKEERVTLKRGQYLRIAPYSDDENGYERVGIRVVPYERPLLPAPKTVKTATDLKKIKSGDYMIVDGKVSLSKSLSLSVLSINPGASLTVPKGKTLTVSGDFGSSVGADSLLTVNGGFVLTGNALLTAASGAGIVNNGSFGLEKNAQVRMELNTSFTNNGEFSVSQAGFNSGDWAMFSNAGLMHLYGGSWVHINNDMYSQPDDVECHVIVNDCPDWMNWDFIGNEDMKLDLSTGDPNELFDYIWRYNGWNFREFVIRYGSAGRNYNIKGNVSLPADCNEYNILMLSNLTVGSGASLSIPECATLTVANSFVNNGIVNLNGYLEKPVSGKPKFTNNGIIYDFGAHIDDIVFAGTGTVYTPADEGGDCENEDDLSENAEPGSTFTLTQDITLTRNLTLTDCTVDLNGHTLTVSDGVVLTLNRNGDDFTCIDVTDDGSRLVVAEKGRIVNDGKIVIGSGGLMTLPRFSYRQNTNDYAGIRLITGNGVTYENALELVDTPEGGWKGSLLGEYAGPVVRVDSCNELNALINAEEFYWYRNFFVYLEGNEGTFTFDSELEIPDKVILISENKTVNINENLSLNCQFSIEGGTVNVNSDLVLRQWSAVFSGDGNTFNIAENSALRLDRESNFSAAGTVNVAEGGRLEVRENSNFHAGTLDAAGSVCVEENCNLDADAALVNSLDLRENAHMNAGEVTVAGSLSVEYSSLNAGTVVNNGFIRLGNNGELGAGNIENHGSIDICGSEDEWARLWTDCLSNDCGNDNAVRLQGFCDVWVNEYDVDRDDNGDPVCRVEYNAGTGSINTSIPHECIWANIDIDHTVSSDELESCFWLRDEGFRNVTVCCSTEQFFGQEYYDIPENFCLRMDGYGPEGTEIDGYVIPEGCTVNVYGQLDVLIPLTVEGTVNILGGLKMREGNNNGSVSFGKNGVMNIFYDWNGTDVNDVNLFPQGKPETEFELEVGDNRMFMETDCFVFTAPEKGHYRFFADGENMNGFAILDYDNPDNELNYSGGYPLDMMLAENQTVRVRIYCGDGRRNDAGLTIIFAEDSYYTLTQDGGGDTVTLAEAIRMAKDNPDDFIVVTTGSDIVVDVALPEYNDLVIDDYYNSDDHYGTGRYLVIPWNLEIRIQDYTLTIDNGFVMTFAYMQIEPTGTLEIACKNSGEYGKLFLAYDEETENTGTIFCLGTMKLWDETNLTANWRIDDPVVFSCSSVDEIRNMLLNRNGEFCKERLGIATIECNAYGNDDFCNALSWANGEYSDNEHSDNECPHRLSVNFCIDQASENDSPEICINQNVTIPENMEVAIRAYRNGDGEYCQRPLIITDGGTLEVNGSITFGGAYVRVDEGSSLVFNGFVGSYGAEVVNNGEIWFNTVMRDLGDWNGEGYDRFRITGDGEVHDCFDYRGDLDKLRELLNSIPSYIDYIFEVSVDAPLTVTGELEIPWNVNLVINSEVNVGTSTEAGSIVNRGTVTVNSGGSLIVRTKGRVDMIDSEDGTWRSEIALRGGTASFNKKIYFTKSPRGLVDIDRGCYESYTAAKNALAGLPDKDVKAHRELYWDYCPERDNLQYRLSNAKALFANYDTLNICLPGDVSVAIPDSWGGVVPDGVYFIVNDGAVLEIPDDVIIRGGIVMEGGRVFVGRHSGRDGAKVTLDGGIICFRKEWSDFSMRLSTIVNSGRIIVREAENGRISCFSSKIINEGGIIEDNVGVAAFVNDMETIDEAIAWQNRYGTFNCMTVSAYIRVDHDVIVPDGLMIYVDESAELFILENVTLALNGSYVENHGTIEVAGTFDGKETGIENDGIFILDDGSRFYLDNGRFDDNGLFKEDCVREMRIALDGMIVEDVVEIELDKGPVTFTGTAEPWQFTPQEYSWELIGDDDVAELQTEDGRAVLIPHSIGSVELRLAYTGDEYGELSEEITVNVGETRYPVVYMNIADGDSNPNPGSHKGSEAMPLENPSRLGYNFLGWYRDSAFKTKITEIPADTYEEFTVYARWSGVITYQVKFAANGGTGTMSVLKKNYKAAAFTPANKFTKKGYSLSGWTAADRNVFTPDEKISMAELIPQADAKNIITLAAQWSPNGYTVEYYANDGESTAPVRIQSFTYDKEQELADALTRTGYVFSGWCVSANGKGTKFAENQSVMNLTQKAGGVYKLYAQWTVAPGSAYTVIFNGNGNTGGSMAAENMVVGTAKALAANAFTPQDGYHFAGWSDDPDGDVLYKDKQSVKDINIELNQNPVNLYAVWEANTYTVTFNANGGKLSNGKTTAYKQTLTYDEWDTLRNCEYSRAGYTFIGWGKSSKAASADYSDRETRQFNLSAKNNGAVTLYAVWKANSCFVRFSSGAPDAEGSTPTQMIPYGKSVALNANGFVNPGYYFKSWKGSNGKTYTNKASVKNLSADSNAFITLTAVWAPDTYSVRFNANGGTGKMSNQSRTFGTAKALTANAFKKTGSVFLGWSTVQNGEVEFTDRQMIDYQILPDANKQVVTLYAVWG